MECKSCGKRMHKNGEHRDGRQRWRCRPCKVTALEEKDYLFGDMRVDEDKALMALNMLCEGMSVRSTSRVTGLHKATVLKLLVYAGEKLERFMADTIQGVPVENVECDEIWDFIYCKERTKKRLKTDDPQKGDAYTFTAIDRETKLIVAWHLGRRTNQHTDVFVEKLANATSGRFQLSTDAFAAYPNAVGYHLGPHLTDYMTVQKEFGNDPEGERRYSPPALTGIKKTRIHGNPDPDRAGTSIVERHNLSIRTFCRRFTRLTIAFSKCWENHKAALALFFAWYNFVKMHKSIQMTPAMKADLTRRPWSLRELLKAAN